MKITDFAVSNSKKSISEALAKHVASLFEESKIEWINLKDYKGVISDVELEINHKIPNKIISLAGKIDSASLLIISLVEHDGSYSAAFKNCYVFLSKIPNRKAFGKKPILLLVPSAEKIGGADVLSSVIDRFPAADSEVLESFSFPNIQQNLIDDRISNLSTPIELIRKVNHLKQTYFKLYYADKRFTCGIDPERGGGNGDAIEY